MSKHIVLIDDSEEFLEITKDILEDAGFRVSAATNLEDSRAFFRANDVNLIICDLVLPSEKRDNAPADSPSVMVGIHAINDLAQSYPAIPIIAISGKITGDYLEAMEEFGAQAALAKPFDRETLLGKVNEILSDA